MQESLFSAIFFRRQWPLALLILGVSMGLSALAAFRNSVTTDEFAHLPMGMRVWQDRVFDVRSGLTPQPSMMAALPVVAFSSAKIEPIPAARLTIWLDGYRFAIANRANYHGYFLLARSVTVLVLAAAGVLTWGFARILYGPAGGLLALAVVAFSPDMLAHGCLVTADVYLAAAVIGSLWALDALLRRPGWRPAVLLGLALGLAALCKYTGFIMLFFLPAAVLLTAIVKWIRPDEKDETLELGRKSCAWGMAALLIATLTINLGYGFYGSLTLLGNYSFRSSPFASFQSLLPSWLPVPLPYPFMAGFDAQLSEGGYDAYLLGKFNQVGFWNYYLVGLLVKTPEPILLLALAAMLFRKKLKLREVPMLALAAMSFIFFSFAGHKNIGVRYLLFLLPMAAVWIGGMTASAFWDRPRRVRFLAGGAALALGWLLLIDVCVWPHYLAYFNAISGGSSRGHEYLLDSNLDWGQDLIALRDYLQREQIKSVDLAYFGRVDPAVYDIPYRPLLNAVPQQRYAVVSANFLWGRMYFVGGTPFKTPNHDWYAPLRCLKPSAVLGYTLYVYDVKSQSAAALRDYVKSVKLDPKDALIQNNLARLLATRGPERGGDPQQAIDLAQRACQLTGGKSSVCLDTLAAAYAAAGRFSEALDAGRKAMKLAFRAGESEAVEQIEARLQLYRENRPYRE